MERAAKVAADSLYERLKTNDFRHVEDGLKSLEARLGERMERLEVRIIERLPVTPDSEEE